MLPYTSHIAKKLKGTATLLFLLFCVCSAVARDTTRVFSKLPWYEDDRLNLVAGDGYLSYYAYGYDGNRAIKMTGTATIDPNGTLINIGDLNNITIYPNEYLSVTQAEYTKYYYAGGNRIASKIGTGGFGKMQQLCTLDQNLTANANTLFDNVLQHAVNTTSQPTDEYPVNTCGGYNVATELLTEPLLDFYINSLNLNFTQSNLLQQFRQNLAGGTEAVYYFHSDHLGSASWITDGSGLPVQHLLYLPFGEHFANEHSSGYDERFTFTGKERDAETGYYYHGARFNSSDIGWLSVDPMADKYPSLTPYNYCAWNPIKLVDADGREFDPETDNKYIKVYENEIIARKKYINELRGTDKWNDDYNAQYEEYNNILSEIENLRKDKKNIYTVLKGVDLGEDAGRFSYGGTYLDGKRQMYVSIADNATNVHLFMGTLAHELKHAYQYYNGEFGFVLKDGIQVSSSDSKYLERQANNRGDMFSGRTKLNNDSFRLDYNLKWESYELDKAYNKYPETTNIFEYSAYCRKYNLKFIYNEK